MEEWKPVMGYEGLYEISNHGNFRSLDRKVYAGRNYYRIEKGREKSTRILKNGYRVIDIQKNGIRKTCYIHHLVAETFIGKRPNGYECCHNDGIRINNHVSNLRYDTPLNNTHDKFKHGTIIYGEKSYNIKLKDKHVIQIKSLADIMTQQTIANIYNVSREHIRDIINGKRRIRVTA